MLADARERGGHRLAGSRLLQAGSRRRASIPLRRLRLHLGGLQLCAPGLQVGAPVAAVLIGLLIELLREAGLGCEDRGAVLGALIEDVAVGGVEALAHLLGQEGLRLVDAAGEHGDRQAQLVGQHGRVRRGRAHRGWAPREHAVRRRQGVLVVRRQALGRDARRRGLRRSERARSERRAGRRSDQPHALVGQRHRRLPGRGLGAQEERVKGIGRRKAFAGVGPHGLRLRRRPSWDPACHGVVLDDQAVGEDEWPGASRVREELHAALAALRHLCVIGGRHLAQQQQRPSREQHRHARSLTVRLRARLGHFRRARARHESSQG